MQLDQPTSSLPDARQYVTPFFANRLEKGSSWSASGQQKRILRQIQEGLRDLMAVSIPEPVLPEASRQLVPERTQLVRIDLSKCSRTIFKSIRDGYPTRARVLDNPCLAAQGPSILSPWVHSSTVEFTVEGWIDCLPDEFWAGHYQSTLFQFFLPQDGRTQFLCSLLSLDEEKHLLEPLQIPCCNAPRLKAILAHPGSYA